MLRNAFVTAALFVKITRPPSTKPSLWLQGDAASFAMPVYAR